MAVDGVVGPQQRSERTRRPSTWEGEQPPLASQLRAARQRATREQAGVVTHWLRRLTLENGAPASSARGAFAAEGRDELDRLARAASTGRLEFGLAVANVSGRFRRVATIQVEERMAVDDVRFNPFNCGGGIRPVGTLNRLRDYAYPLAQRPWTSRRA